MHRFYISPEKWNSGALTLTGSEAHHARDVLRVRRGDKVALFNGQGREITAEIADFSGDEIGLRKLHEAETAVLRCRIVLGQAIPKGKNMELIVQKAVEIGAAEIAPIISDRTIVQIDSERAAQKQAKWQQIAIEAAKQCGQNWLPRVRTPCKLKDFLASVAAVEVYPPRRDRRSNLSFDLRLIASLRSDAQHLKKILAAYTIESAENPSPLLGERARVRENYVEEKQRHLPTNVLMMIGPEGDFTAAEVALAKSHGCQPITLGPIILRVETAAIYCLSVLSYELFA